MINILAARLQQPRALVPLFLTEMWERFGYYIVQGLLALFLLHKLHYTDSLAYAVTGSYSALIFISPLFGGYLANHVLGYRRSVLLGGILLTLGYTMLAISEHALFWGLATVIIGNGFLKPNISSFLGEFYGKEDPQREAGFTLFYVGINLGGFLGTSIGGYVQTWLGWSATFTMASLGLVLGILTFVWNRKILAGRGENPTGTLPKQLAWLAHTWVLIGLIVLSTWSIQLLLTNKWMANALMLVLVIAITSYLLWQMRMYEKQWRFKMLALLILTVASVFFWALYFQMYLAINVFIDRDVFKNILHMKLTTLTYFSFEQLFVIFLGPIFAWLWPWLQRRKRNPVAPVKFVWSFAFLSLGFAVLYFSMRVTPPNTLLYGGWVALSYLLIAMGEMCLSPIGLSIVTELAHPKQVGLMMGVWFMSLGFGGEIAGLLAEIGAVPQSDVGSQVARHAIYQHAFGVFSLIGLLMMMAVMACLPFLRRLLKAESSSNTV